MCAKIRPLQYFMYINGHTIKLVVVVVDVVDCSIMCRFRRFYFVPLEGERYADFGITFLLSYGSAGYGCLALSKVLMASLPYALPGLHFVDLIPGPNFWILQLLQLYLIKY